MVTNLELALPVSPVLFALFLVAMTGYAIYRLAKFIISVYTGAGGS